MIRAANNTIPDIDQPQLVRDHSEVGDKKSQNELKTPEDRDKHGASGPQNENVTACAVERPMQFRHQLTEALLRSSFHAIILTLHMGKPTVVTVFM